MEMNQMEVAQIQEVVLGASDDQLRNLLDLRLAFSGGGLADTIAF